MSDNENLEEDDDRSSGTSRKFPEPTIQDMLNGNAVPSEMLRDLYTISKLETAALSSVVQALGTLDGLGSQESLETLISSALGADDDKSIAKAIRRTVSNLVPSSVTDVLTSIAKWVDVDRENRQELFSEQSIDCLIANLDVLVVKNVDGKLFRKAERLLRDVGNEFRGVKFICDLRPVFDDPRKRVDAFVILANMRVRYATQGGDQEAFELALTEDELAKLRKEIDHALDKVNVLKLLRKGLVNSQQEAERG
jgi:hypothetical protein